MNLCPFVCVGGAPCARSHGAGDQWCRAIHHTVRFLGGCYALVSAGWLVCFPTAPAKARLPACVLWLRSVTGCGQQATSQPLLLMAPEWPFLTIFMGILSWQPLLLMSLIMDG